MTLNSDYRSARFPDTKKARNWSILSTINFIDNFTSYSINTVQFYLINNSESKTFSFKQAQIYLLLVEKGFAISKYPRRELKNWAMWLHTHHRNSICHPALRKLLTSLHIQTFIELQYATIYQPYSCLNLPFHNILNKIIFPYMEYFASF